jgi:hypothetical protein
MDRRRFLVAAGATAAAVPMGTAPASAVLALPPGNQIGFKVLRNGNIIGEHHLAFTQLGNDLTVAISAVLAVKLAGITVFSYSLAATERWSDGVFQSVDSKVNDNGTKLEVHAKKNATGYDIVGTEVPHYVGPRNTLPLTYWNRAFLTGTILNIQTAHSYPAIVTSPGWNKLPTAAGGTITAQRFDVTGKLHLSVWYDQYDQWSGLEFHVNGDETYQKIV